MWRGGYIVIKYISDLERCNYYNCADRLNVIIILGDLVDANMIINIIFTYGRRSCVRVKTQVQFTANYKARVTYPRRRVLRFFFINYTVRESCNTTRCYYYHRFHRDVRNVYALNASYFNPAAVRIYPDAENNSRSSLSSVTQRTEYSRSATTGTGDYVGRIE